MHSLQDRTDAQILALVGSRLEASGYQVISAANGTTALAIACAHPGPIHLLITDLRMPNIPGGDVARAVRQIIPGLPTLFLGGQVGVGLDAGPLTEADVFLQKPFNSADLLPKVRQILDRHRAGRREIRDCLKWNWSRARRSVGPAFSDGRW